MTASLSMSLWLAMPELILAVGAMALLMIGAFSGERSSGSVTVLGVLVLIAAGAWIILAGGEGTAFGGAIILDSFGRVMMVLTLIGATAALVMSARYGRNAGFYSFEYPVMILLSTTGMMLMISAHNLIGIYLGLELQNLGLYVLTAFHRDNARSSESGVKYFILSSLNSGLLLYGITLVYGYTGSVDFHQIAAALSAGPRSVGLIVGIVFVLIGLVFKISAAPFHMWTPDVYEGAPTPVTTFLASAAKMAAMSFLLRTTVDAFQPAAIDWQQIIVFVSIASMLLGSFGAIGQRNFKRLMAYSSIGHMGFALVGLSADTVAGVHGVVIYMLIYLAMTLGTFAFILSMRRRGEQVERIDDMAGLAHTNPVMATIMAILLFSLAGIPPLAGFWAKWYVFLAAINAHLYALAVIGVVTSVVAAFYYIRIIKIMWFDEAGAGFSPMAMEMRVVFGLSGAFVLFYVLIGGPLGRVAEAAAKSFF